MFERAVDCQDIQRGSTEYPASLERLLGDAAPARLITFGNRELLGLGLLGIFSSIRTPPDLVLRTLDLARLARTRTPMIGGFQSPLERECLHLLLRGTQPVVICLSRAIEGMRIPLHWRGPLRQGRIVVVSGVPGRSRPTVRGALARNRLVAALAERVMIAHARPGSRTFRMATLCVSWRKPTYCFEHRGNTELILLGATPVTAAALLQEAT